MIGSCPEPVSLKVALGRTRESCGIIREEEGRGAESEEDALDGQAIIWGRETPDVEKKEAGGRSYQQSFPVASLQSWRRS